MEIGERGGKIAMVKNGMLVIAVVSVAIKVVYVEAVAHETKAQKRHYGNDGDTLKQSL